MANSAADQAKTFASEIEVVTRKNPLGAIAAALCVGVLIGSSVEATADVGQVSWSVWV